MSHRKTFIGTILSVTQSKIIMSSQASPNSEPISLAAGAVVLEQARSLIGRTVRYTAELDTSTAELTRPQFVIGSEYGLRAQVVIRSSPYPFASQDALNSYAEYQTLDSKTDAAE